MSELQNDIVLEWDQYSNTRHITGSHSGHYYNNHPVVTKRSRLGHVRDQSKFYPIPINQFAAIAHFFVEGDRMNHAPSLSRENAPRTTPGNKPHDRRKLRDLRPVDLLQLYREKYIFAESNPFPKRSRRSFLKFLGEPNRGNSCRSLFFLFTSATLVRRQSWSRSPEVESRIQTR